MLLSSRAVSAGNTLFEKSVVGQFLIVRLLSVGQSWSLKVVKKATASTERILKLFIEVALSKVMLVSALMPCSVRLVRLGVPKWRVVRASILLRYSATIPLLTAFDKECTQFEVGKQRSVAKVEAECRIVDVVDSERLEFSEALVEIIDRHIRERQIVEVVEGAAVEVTHLAVGDLQVGEAGNTHAQSCELRVVEQCEFREDVGVCMRAAVLRIRLVRAGRKCPSKLVILE